MAQRQLDMRRLLGAIISFLILAAVLALFFQYRHQVAHRLVHFHGPRISSSIRHLPYYAFCSFYRMLAAYVAALIFSIGFGTLAARNRAWERVLIPAIDVAQSVPVIGFFPAAIYFFVSLSRGGRLGVELAAIFLIFTSQAWNMALGVFESIKTIPADSLEVLDSYGAGRWLRFSTLLLPASVPKLVYNSILSWVAGWYFLIACELISVGAQSYRLPGLGSFLMQSADKGRVGELAAGLLTLLGIIVVMDLLVWQPLSAWAGKFRYEFAAASEPMQSLALSDLAGSLGARLAHAMRALLLPVGRAMARGFAAIPRPSQELTQRMSDTLRAARNVTLIAVVIMLAWAITSGFIALVRELAQPWPAEAKTIPAAAMASMARLLIAYAISLAWTLPCALAASDSPRFSRIITPLAEIAGSMPATALFPLIVLFVIRLTGGMNLASVLLILTGMQWYLLFNLLAGVRSVPEDLKETARSFGLSRLETWRRLMVPALVPSLITGSITAWGGGWNALIISEFFIYRGVQYRVPGLGALLDEATYLSGNGVMIMLSLLTMVVVVMTLNRLVWRRFYNFATERYRLDY
jgi:NitT/TauT family transport system permease protein